MPRARNSAATRRRRKKVLRQARGAKGGRSRLFKNAKETIRRARAYAFRDRRVKKRVFRALWIARISAAARSNGLSYSHFIFGLKNAGIEIDRKVLADIAINDDAAFSVIAEKARAAGPASIPTEQAAGRN